MRLQPRGLPSSKVELHHRTFVPSNAVQLGSTPALPHEGVENVNDCGLAGQDRHLSDCQLIIQSLTRCMDNLSTSLPGSSADPPHEGNHTMTTPPLPNGCLHQMLDHNAPGAVPQLGDSFPKDLLGLGYADD